MTKDPTVTVTIFLSGVCGFLALVYGAFKAWPPLGYIVAGLMLLAFAGLLIVGGAIEK